MQVNSHGLDERCLLWDSSALGVSVWDQHYSVMTTGVRDGNVCCGVLGVHVVNVEVQAEEQNDSNEGRDECEEDELLEEAGLLNLDSKLVLLLGQLVARALQEDLANIIHYQ